MDRYTHLCDLADGRIVECQNHLVVQDLRVIHCFFSHPCRCERNVGGLEFARPFLKRPRLDDARNGRAQLHLSGLLTAPPLIEAVFLDQCANPHDSGGNFHKAGMNASELHPFPIAALIDAVERRAAGRMGLEDVFRDVFAEHFRVIKQGPSHQGCLDSPSTASFLACKKR